MQSRYLYTTLLPTARPYEAAKILFLFFEDIYTIAPDISACTCAIGLERPYQKWPLPAVDN